MARLEGKVAIVTGGARGIGQAYATALAGEGASVVVADVGDATGTVEEITAKGGRAIAVTTDITDPGAVQAMVDRTLGEYGRIDILLNNAAIYAGLTFTPFEAIDIEEWDRVYAVNVRGTFLCCRAVAPTMREQRSGKIINISSATALLGIFGVLHYASSKGAVISMTRCLARELGEFNITVNTITPGFTMTEASRQIMSDSGMEGLEQMVLAGQSIKRPEQPEDLVGAALFLASADSDFMTGQIVNVDGGVYPV